VSEEKNKEKTTQERQFRIAERLAQFYHVRADNE